MTDIPQHQYYYFTSRRAIADRFLDFRPEIVERIKPSRRTLRELLNVWFAKQHTEFQRASLARTEKRLMKVAARAGKHKAKKQDERKESDLYDMPAKSDASQSKAAGLQSMRFTSKIQSINMCFLAAHIVNRP